MRAISRYRPTAARRTTRFGATSTRSRPSPRSRAGWHSTPTGWTSRNCPLNSKRPPDFIPRGCGFGTERLADKLLSKHPWIEISTRIEYLHRFSTSSDAVGVRVIGPILPGAEIFHSAHEIQMVGAAWSMIDLGSRTRPGDQTRV